ncbi:MAG: glucose-6-phosphate dehydrogenase [Deltaproteobacteria bacterium]
MAEAGKATAVGPLPEEALSQAVAPPCLLVLFGASGDLTARKLVPALYGLFRERLLPPEFALLGVSRTAYTDEAFREHLRDGMREHAPAPFDPEAWREFASRLFYHAADIEDPAAGRSLSGRIEALCRERSIPGNLLFYAAVAPRFYAPVVRRIGEAGLADPTEALPGFRRVIVEKPFGRDLASARELSRRIRAVFPEEQVYRIDHYLGKETVQNLLVFRFANGIFEPIWNRNYIDHVQITVAETIGVGSRGGYYERSGAVRDMIQNHLIQLLALVAMEPPVSLSADDVRNEKVKLLRSIEPVPEERAGEVCVRGQYAGGTVGGKRVAAYREEAGVDPASLTETYAAFRFTVDNWRWGGVPFYLRTGKRMGRAVSEIAIGFRPAPYRLFENTACGQMDANLLVLNIQPEEGIFLRMGAKFPGPSICVQPVDFRFSYEQAFGVKRSPAYGRLLLDAMHGDATLFPREDTVEVSWALLDPFLRRWEKDPGRDLFFYPAGSDGPPEAEAMLAREGRRWRIP